MIARWTGWVNKGFLSSTWPKPALSASPITKGAEAHRYTDYRPLRASSHCQASPDPPEHPWELDAVLGGWRGVGFWLCTRVPSLGAQFFGWYRHSCCPCWQAGRTPVCPSEWRQPSLGGDAAGAAATAVPCAEAWRKGRCSVPRVLGRILRKQQGRNKRHWLVGWPCCYSEPARISKAGVIHSSHHSNMVILEIQEGKSQPCWIHGSFLWWDQWSFHLVCLVFGRSSSSVSETDFVEVRVLFV